MVFEFILTGMVICVLLYALFAGCTININITTKQEFSSEDRALLEDLFNEQGDPKEKTPTMQEALDEMLKNVNAIMLGDEEGTNG